MNPLPVFLLFLAGLPAAAVEQASPPSGDATIQFRILGLFDRQRVDELSQQAGTIPDVQLAKVDFEAGTATFSYASDLPPFRNAPPETLARVFQERLNAATKAAFQLLPPSEFPLDQRVEVRIPVAGLDCRGCSFTAYNAIATLDGVERALASFHEGHVTAWIDPARTNRETLVAALKKREVKVVE